MGWDGALRAGVSVRYASGTPAVVPGRCNGRGRTAKEKGNMMRKTKGPSWTVLAIMLVLALAGYWTGWTEDVATWGLGHVRDLIPDHSG